MTIDPALIVQSAIHGGVAFAITVATWWTCRLTLRRHAERETRGPGRWFAALFLPMGYAVAHWIIISAPNFRGGAWNSLDGNTRIFLIAPLALLLGALLASPLPRLLRGAFMLLGAGAVAWAVVGTVHPDYLGSTNRMLWLGGVTIGMWLTWCALEIASSRRAWIGLLTATALAGVTPPLVGIIGANGVYAQGAAVLSAMLAALLLLALWPGGATITRGGTALVALLLGAYWVMSTETFHGRLPSWSPAGLPLVAWLGAAATLLLTRRRPASGDT